MKSKSHRQRNNGKTTTTLGEFIMAAYDTWGQRGRGAVRLAIRTHLVEANLKAADFLKALDRGLTHAS